MKNLKIIPYYMFFLVSSFYFLQYILRVAPCIIKDDLMIDFSFNSTQFGFFVSLSCLSYGITQIPIGILTDRYGIKPSLLSCITCCMGGVLLLSQSAYIPFAYLSRILIGIGTGGSFLLACKTVCLMFDEKKQPLMTGAIIFMGQIGALLSSVYFPLLLSDYHWRKCFLFLFIAGILVFLANLFFLKIPPTLHQTSENFSLKHLKESMGQLLIIGIISAALYLPLPLITYSWGIGLLSAKYGIDKTHAGGIISTLFVGLMTGSLALGKLAEHVKNRVMIIASCLFFCVLAFELFIASFLYPFWVNSLLLFIIGFCIGGEGLCFVRSASLVEKEHSASAVSLVNTIGVLFGFLFQWIVGFVMDQQWTGKFLQGEVKAYTFDNYQTAFYYPLAFMIIALLISTFIKNDLTARGNHIKLN